MRNHIWIAFLRPLVGTAVLILFSSAHASPATPAETFGFQPGDDYKLASYEQMERYYRQLADESDRGSLGFFYQGQVCRFSQPISGYLMEFAGGGFVGKRKAAITALASYSDDEAIPMLIAIARLDAFRQRRVVD